MSDAREAILARLRMGGREPAPAPAPAAVPEWDRPTLVRRFRDNLEAVAGELRSTAADTWPRDVAAFLAEAGVERLAYGPGTEAGRKLAGACGDLRLVPHNRPHKDARDALFEADAGFTTARGAIAETGSLVLWPDAGEPRLLSLVPPIHVALLKTADLHPTLAGVMAAEDWAAGMPTNALLVTGPSKTADIEQTLVHGVHGPRRLVVFLLDEGR